MEQLRRLIFFAGSDPRTDPHPIWRAYHFAHCADAEGLQTEVRLAGDAVRVAHREVLEGAGGRAGELAAMIKERAAAGLLVSL